MVVAVMLLEGRMVVAVMLLEGQMVVAVKHRCHQPLKISSPLPTPIYRLLIPLRFRMAFGLS
jgi:hypothetical protein